MNLEREGEWDKDWMVFCYFFSFSFISFHQTSICISLYVYIYMHMSMYEYLYFDYIVFHVYIENEKKCSHKKRNIRKISELHRITA